MAHLSPYLRLIILLLPLKHITCNFIYLIKRLCSQQAIPGRMDHERNDSSNRERYYLDSIGAKTST